MNKISKNLYKAGCIAAIVLGMSIEADCKGGFGGGGRGFSGGGRSFSSGRSSSSSFSSGKSSSSGSSKTYSSPAPKVTPKTPSSSNYGSSNAIKNYSPSTRNGYASNSKSINISSGKRYSRASYVFSGSHYSSSYHSNGIFTPWNAFWWGNMMGHSSSRNSQTNILPVPTPMPKPAEVTDEYETFTQMLNPKKLDFFTDKGIVGSAFGKAKIDKSAGVSVVMADIDGDGALETIVASPYGIKCFEKTSKGFVDKGLIGDPQTQKNAGVSMAIGDRDNDGDLDIFIGSSYGVKYFENTRKGFVDRGIIPGTQSTQKGAMVSVAAGDLAGNGRLDIVTASPDGIKYFENTGKGFVDKGTIGCTSAISNEAGVGITLGKIKKDGKLDILIADSEGIEYFENTGKGFAYRGVIGDPSASAGNSGVGIAIGDLNENLSAEIITADPDGIKYFENKESDKNPQGFKCYK